MKNTFHAVFTAALIALACTALHGQTSYSTTLTNAISPSQTANVCLGSNTGVTLPSLMNGTAGSYLKIDSESVQVTAANAVPGCYKVRRGVFGTSPALHAAGAAVAVNPATNSTGDPSRPVTGLPTQGGTNGSGGASSGGAVTSGAITTALGYTPASLDGTGKVPASQLPASFASVTVKYTSQLPGVITTACLLPNPKDGINFTRGTCVDNGTAAVNTFLATASVSNPIRLIHDMRFGTTGIVAPNDNTEIICLPGAGFSVITGANAPVIHTGLQFQPAPGTPPAQKSNFTLRGCILDGNRNATPLNTGGGAGNSANADPRGTPITPGAGGTWAAAGWLTIVHISNRNNVDIDSNVLFDSPTYGAMLSSVTNGHIHNNKVITKGVTLNQDCFHLNGPWLNIHIDHNYCNGFDDAVGGNAVEGYGGTGNFLFIDHEYWDNVLNGLRLYTALGTPAPTVTIDNVFVDHIFGNGRRSFMKLGGETDSSQGVTDPVVLNQIGAVSVSNVKWNSFYNPIELAESTKRLTLTDVSFTSTNPSSIFNATNGTSNLQTLNIVSLDAGTIPGLVEALPGFSYTGPASAAIVSVVGPGVMQWGINLPDAKIGNSTTFLSDGSAGTCTVGALCWKSNNFSQQILANSATPAIANVLDNWICNEGTGGCADSTTGAFASANNLTVTGAMTWTAQTGFSHTIPTYSGSTGVYQTATNHTNVLDGTASTIAFRASWTALGSYDVILSNRDASSGNKGFMVIKADSTGGDRLQLSVSDGTATAGVAWNFVPTAGTMYDIVLTTDNSKSTTGMNLYVDGTLQTKFGGGGGSFTGSAATLINWKVGIDTSLTAPHNGKIANILISSAVASQSQVTARHTTGPQ